MAISMWMNWEVDKISGNDLNGGGCIYGSVDKTLSAPIIRSDIQTVAATQLVSASIPFDSTDVGNVIQLISGGGITPGFYEIVSITDSTVTLDRSTGVAGSTATIVGRVGGPLASIPKALNAHVSGNSIYVKSVGTYTISSPVTLLAGTTTVPTRIIGYTASRTDGGLVTINNTGSLNIFSLTNGNVQMKNFYIDAITGSATSGVVCAAINVYIENVHVVNFAGSGISLSTGYAELNKCSVSNGRGTPTAGFNISVFSALEGCVAIGPGKDSGINYVGFQLNSTNSAFLNNCVSAKHATHGYNLINATSGAYFRNCISYNNLSNGFHFSIAGSELKSDVRNCIIANNVGYGIKFPTASVYYSIFDYNAYYLNGSGTMFGYSQGPNDILLDEDPFIDSANNDFRLKQSCPLIGVGSPGNLPYINNMVYNDIGLQHEQIVGTSSKGHPLFSQIIGR